jgi:hypothetical protein
MGVNIMTVQRANIEIKPSNVKSLSFEFSLLDEGEIDVIVETNDSYRIVIHGVFVALIGDALEMAVKNLNSIKGS